MARMLANENVPGDVVTALLSDGHDVTWMRDVGPGAPDDRVLALAFTEGRIVLTFDKDFGELAFRLGQQATPGVIFPAPPPFARPPRPVHPGRARPGPRLGGPLRRRRGGTAAARPAPHLIAFMSRAGSRRKLTLHFAAAIRPWPNGQRPNSSRLGRDPALRMLGRDPAYKTCKTRREGVCVMFEKGVFVTINNRIGVVVRTGRDLCEGTGHDLNDHTGVWFGTMDGSIPEVWTIPTEYLSRGPEPKLNH